MAKPKRPSTWLSVAHGGSAVSPPLGVDGSSGGRCGLVVHGAVELRAEQHGVELSAGCGGEEGIDVHCGYFRSRLELESVRFRPLEANGKRRGCRHCLPAVVMYETADEEGTSFARCCSDDRRAHGGSVQVVSTRQRDPLSPKPMGLPRPLLGVATELNGQAGEMTGRRVARSVRSSLSSATFGHANLPEGAAATAAAMGVDEQRPSGEFAARPVSCSTCREGTTVADPSAFPTTRALARRLRKTSHRWSYSAALAETAGS